MKKMNRKIVFLVFLLCFVPPIIIVSKLSVKPFPTFETFIKTGYASSIKNSLKDDIYASKYGGKNKLKVDLSFLKAKKLSISNLQESLKISSKLHLIFLHDFKESKLYVLTSDVFLCFPMNITRKSKGNFYESSIFLDLVKKERNHVKKLKPEVKKQFENVLNLHGSKLKSQKFHSSSQITISQSNRKMRLGLLYNSSYTSRILVSYLAWKFRNMAFELHMTDTDRVMKFSRNKSLDDLRHSSLSREKLKKAIIKKTEILIDQSINTGKILNFNLNDVVIKAYILTDLNKEYLLYILGSLPLWLIILGWLGPIFGSILLFMMFAWRDKEASLQSDWIDYFSHEFQTPIHGIMLCTKLLDNQDSKAVQMISKQAEYLSYVHKVFLRSSTLSKFEIIVRPQPCSIESIIDESWSLVSKIHEVKTPHLTKDIRVNEVSIDGGLLQELLINLMDNSCKYNVQVPKIELKAWTENNRVCIEVSDNGIGIPEYLIDKVTEKCFRFQKEGFEGVGGTGLGLYISQEIMKAHGETLKIVSTISGSNITITLPLDQ